MPQLADVLGSTQIQVITILIAADVILGVLGALMRKEFRFGKVAAFMRNGVVGYVFAYAVLASVGEALPQLAFVVQVAYVLVVVALIASLLRNLKKLGLPLPGSNMI